MGLRERLFGTAAKKAVERCQECGMEAPEHASWCPGSKPDTAAEAGWEKAMAGFDAEREESPAATDEQS